MISNTSERELIIEPGRSGKNYWGDIWNYRELFFFLAWRDILVRYKQTVIGLAWSIIRPFLTIVIMTVVFGQLAKMSSGGAPYAILVCAATLPWMFFSTAFSDSSNSLIANSNMLTKIYFPRLIVPGSTVIVNFIDFLISLVILIGMMFWYHYVPTWNILVLPLFFILALFTALGAGFYVAAVNVKYRDFRYIVPFIVQFGLFISPVGYSTDTIAAKYGETGRMLYSLNPMVGVIDGFRWCILGRTNSIYLPGLFISIVFTILLFSFGVWYFRKMEKSFADVI